MIKHQKFVPHLAVIVISLFSLALPASTDNSGEKTQLQVSEAITIYLIRHAEKRTDQGNDPELTEQGVQRANFWAKLFSIIELDAVYSTDTKRTQSTAAPIAREHDLTVQSYSALPVNTSKFIASNAGNAIVMVGHSNTVPQWVNAFIDESRYSDLNDNQYSELFIVTLNGNDKSARQLAVPLE